MDPATPFHQTRSREAPFQFLVVYVDPRNAMTTPSQCLRRLSAGRRAPAGKRLAAVTLASLYTNLGMKRKNCATHSEFTDVAATASGPASHP
jgi:hypothetical protein